MKDTQIMYFLAFIGALIPIFTIVIKVNGTLTKLNVSIDILTNQMSKSEKDRTRIHDVLNNHETRITILEKKEEK